MEETEDATLDRKHGQTLQLAAQLPNKLPGLIHAQYRLLGPVGHPQTSLHHATSPFDLTVRLLQGYAADGRLSVRSAADALFAACCRCQLTLLQALLSRLTSYVAVYSC
jgi:hypothetical protein